jgi:hypothetical protein
MKQLKIVCLLLAVHSLYAMEIVQTKVVIDDATAKGYLLTDNDRKKITTQKQLELVKRLGGITGCTPMTEERINIVLSLKDLDVFKTERYRNKIIDIPEPQLTQLDRLKDACITSGPFCFVSLMPDFICYQTNGILQDLAGAALFTVGGAAIGEKLVPILQSCHSDSCNQAEYFGPTNCIKINNKEWFLWMSLCNYACASVAQFALRYGGIPCYMIGGGVYALRAYILKHCFRILSVYNKSNRTNNADRTARTLGDLLDGPKFAE